MCMFSRAHAHVVRVQEADKLKEALRQLLEQPGSTAGELQQVAQLYNALREKVVDAVTEARAFAAQQQSDLATLKRSSAQVGLRAHRGFQGAAAGRYTAGGESTTGRVIGSGDTRPG